MDECVDQQGFDLIVFNSVAQYFNCLAHTSDMPDSVGTLGLDIRVLWLHTRVIFFLYLTSDTKNLFRFGIYAEKKMQKKNCKLSTVFYFLKKDFMSEHTIHQHLK